MAPDRSALACLGLGLLLGTCWSCASTRSRCAGQALPVGCALQGVQNAHICQNWGRLLKKKRRKYIGVGVREAKSVKAKARSDSCKSATRRGHARGQCIIADSSNEETLVSPVAWKAERATSVVGCRGADRAAGDGTTAIRRGYGRAGCFLPGRGA